MVAASSSLLDIYLQWWHIPKGGSVPLNNEVRQRVGPSSIQSLTVMALPDLIHIGLSCWVVFFSTLYSTD